MTTHRTRRWAPAAVLALLASPSSDLPASAGGHQHVQTVEFVGAPGAQQFLLDHVVVSGGRHVVPYTRTGSSFSGDLTGTTSSAGLGTGNSTDRLAGGEIVLFDGAVDGCGSGGATIVAYAAGTASGGLKGTWFIVDGQGTDDLAQLSGGGVLDTPPGGATTFRGLLRCD
jgi:hypothetical protein